MSTLTLTLTLTRTLRQYSFKKTIDPGPGPRPRPRPRPRPWPWPRPRAPTPTPRFTDIPIHYTIKTCLTKKYTVNSPPFFLLHRQDRALTGTGSHLYRGGWRRVYSGVGKEAGKTETPSIFLVSSQTVLRPLSGFDTLPQARLGTLETRMVARNAKRSISTILRKSWAL